jgi:hypothetical protein
MRRGEHPLADGVLRLLVPCIEVGDFIYCGCVAEKKEVTHWVITATREVFSEAEGVWFRSWIAQATELPY